MLVRAVNGLQVAREDNPRRYIGAEPVEVEESSYYLRRLADGEIERVTAAPAKAAPAPAFAAPALSKPAPVPTPAPPAEKDEE